MGVKVKKRLELRSALTIEDTLMVLDLWRMMDNTFTAEIETNGCKLSANADSTAELKDFLSKSSEFLGNF
jgi:hypothetical protein